MSKKVWAADAVSVVILPSGEQGRKILQLAQEWSTGWLLTPALWLLSDEIPVSAHLDNDDPSSPPKLHAYMLGRNENNEPEQQKVELFWTLGSQEFKRIRLVAVRTEQDPEQLERTSAGAHSAAKYLAASMPVPRDSSRENPLGAQFIKVNLVVAPTEEDRLLEGVLEQGWDANLIASAEDRPTPLSFDSFVNTEDHYIGFVLAHIATTAGLWAGLPISSAEIDGDRTGLKLARLQRVFVRAVASDTLSADVARWALDQANASENALIAGKLEGKDVALVIEDHEKARIASLVDYVMSGPKLETEIVGSSNFLYKEYELTEFANYEPTLTEKLIARLRDIAEAFAHLFKWYKATASYRIERAMDAEASREGLYKAIPDRLAPDIKARVPDIASATTVPRLAKPSPELWSHVRQSISSAIDAPTATNHPEPLYDEQRNRLIFANLSRVLPDPDAHWEPGEFSEQTTAILSAIDWLDAAKVDEMLNNLETRRDELAPGMDEARLLLKDTEDNVADLEAKLQRAVFELDRVTLELDDDVEFAEEMRADHTHKLPEKLVGPARPSVIEEDEVVIDVDAVEVGHATEALDINEITAEGNLQIEEGDEDRG